MCVRLYVCVIFAQFYNHCARRGLFNMSSAIAFLEVRIFVLWRRLKYNYVLSQPRRKLCVCRAANKLSWWFAASFSSHSDWLHFAVSRCTICWLARLFAVRHPISRRWVGMDPFVFSELPNSRRTWRTRLINYGIPSGSTRVRFARRKQDFPTALRQ